MNKRDILRWSRTLILDYCKRNPEDDEDQTLAVLAMDRLDDISDYYKSRYVQKTIRKFSQIKRLCTGRGFEVISEDKDVLSIRNGTHGFILMLNRYCLHVCPDIPLTPYGRGTTSFKNMNPRYVMRCLDLFCSQKDRLAELVHRLYPEGRRLAKIAEISHPYLVERMEGSGVLAGYEHSMRFEYSATRLEITDICHGDHDYYEGEVTMENVEDIIRRLPAALSDFGNFERHFPEFASCYSR